MRGKNSFAVLLNGYFNFSRSKLFRSTLWSGATSKAKLNSLQSKLSNSSSIPELLI